MSKYTKQDVQKKINDLLNKSGLLKRKRLELSQSINSIKKQIEFWESLDDSQLKLL